MQIYKKEKIGKKRIITIFGLKFTYHAGRKYKYEPVTACGVNETPRAPKVIVSLTSFPARIVSLHKTVTSLLNQTFKPDAVVLWLAQEQFPGGENDLTPELLNLKQYGLTIRWCNDIRSFKKLVPALKEFPNDIIITADDDIYYDKVMVERLYDSYLKAPENIHCHRVTKIFRRPACRTGGIPIKAKGGGKHFYKKPSFANKLVGMAGVLYPPNSLYKDITDEKLFMELAPTNDDIWFWLMAVLNDRKIRVIKGHIPNPPDLDETLSTPCLTQINDHGDNLFYTQLANVLNHYPGLESKLFIS
ncbi:MAG: hypothetical protein LBJ74_00365 [Heliobacteriaceae bacterium]|jgi:hypothetical protein|nr:hypothetical protein [Heliobacteriaceae bacterium]